MGEKTLKEMVTVLPDCLCYDNRCIFRDVAENFHAVLLAVDETVTFLGIESMAAPDLASLLFNGLDQQGFHGLLRLLAFLVGGGAKIAIGDKDDFLGAHIVLGVWSEVLSDWVSGSLGMGGKQCAGLEENACLSQFGQ